MMRLAFSLFETLLTLVILGIFATLGFVWLPDSKLYLAQNQIIAHLQYTRFLSLNTTKHITQSAFCQSDFCEDERRRWEESLWRLQFSSLQKIGYVYYLFSDSARSARTKHFDDLPRDRQEIARDLLDNKYLNVYNVDNSKFANSARAGDLAITQRFSVRKVRMIGGCGDGYGARILFNEQGFLRCKKPFEKITLPTGSVKIELQGSSGEIVGVCILESGLIEKC